MSHVQRQKLYHEHLLLASLAIQTRLPLHITYFIPAADADPSELCCTAPQCQRWEVSALVPRTNQRQL